MLTGISIMGVPVPASEAFQRGFSGLTLGSTLLNSAIEDGFIDPNHASRSLGRVLPLAQAVTQIANAAADSSRDSNQLGGFDVLGAVDVLKSLEKVTGRRHRIIMDRFGRPCGVEGFEDSNLGFFGAIRKAAKSVGNAVASAAKTAANAVADAAKSVAKTAEKVFDKAAEVVDDVRKELRSWDPTSTEGRARIAALAEKIPGVGLFVKLMILNVADLLNCIKNGGAAKALSCLGDFIINSLKDILTSPEFKILLGIVLTVTGGVGLILIVTGAAALLSKTVMSLFGTTSTVAQYAVAGLGMIEHGVELIGMLFSQGVGIMKSAAFYMTVGQIFQKLPGHTIVAKIGNLLYNNAGLLVKVINGSVESAMAEVRSFIESALGSAKKAAGLSGDGFGSVEELGATSPGLINFDALNENIAGLRGLGSLFDKMSVAKGDGGVVQRVLAKITQPFTYLKNFFNKCAEKLAEIVEVAKKGIVFANAPVATVKNELADAAKKAKEQLASFDAKAAAQAKVNAAKESVKAQLSKAETRLFKTDLLETQGKAELTSALEKAKQAAVNETAVKLAAEKNKVSAGEAKFAIEQMQKQQATAKAQAEGAVEKIEVARAARTEAQKTIATVKTGTAPPVTKSGGGAGLAIAAAAAAGIFLVSR